MKRSLYRKIIPVVIGFLLMPALIYAQSEQTAANTPPVEQPLVREGDFAVELVFSFALGTTADDVEAENLLSANGITPRNGWIADYPVTPDIVGEIWDSISTAVDSKKLSMNRDEAAKRYQQAKADVGLDMRPYASGETHELNPSSNYPDNTVINNYYYNQGPPVVTYFAPPPDYYYLYSWVPYPFWWYDFWFPGYFILNDFHRVVHFRNRTEFISNHFNDAGHHRVFRIDPLDRFHGRTLAGIGAPRKGNFISSGVKNGSRSIFNRNRISPPSSGRSLGTPSVGRSFNAPSGGGSPRPSSGGRSSGKPSGGKPGSVDRDQRR